MGGALDRESRRATVRDGSEWWRRLAMEHAIEHLSDFALKTLFDGLVHLHEHHAEADQSAPSLAERIDAHAAATRRGEYLGEYIRRRLTLKDALVLLHQSRP